MQLPLSNTVSITLKYTYKRGNALDFFDEIVDSQFKELMRGESEEVMREVDPVEVLDPVTAEALKIVRNAGKDTVSTAMEFYFNCRP